MSGSTLRTSLFALVLFGIAGYLGYNHWSKPIDPDNGNLILDKDANVSADMADLVHLGELGSAATPSDVNRLLTALKDSDAAVRVEAAMALGKVPSTDPAVVTSLNEAARDTDPGVRSAALIGLDDHSRAAKEASDPRRTSYEEMVIAALGDPVPRVRRIAVTTLRARPEGSLSKIEEIARAEIKTLADVDPPTRIAAVGALRDLPKIAGPGLTAGTVTMFAGELPNLLKGVADADMRSRPEYQGLVRTVAESISKAPQTPVTAEQSKAIRDSLAALFADKRDESRRAVIEVFPDIAGMVGTDAERAEILRGVLKDSDSRVRSAAYRALWANPLVAKPEGQAARTELREATKGWIAELAKPDSKDRELAAWLLSWTDREDADAALAALAAQKDASDEGLKNRVAKATEALEAAKKSESWPEPAWKPFRTGPPPAMTGAGLAPPAR